MYPKLTVKVIEWLRDTSTGASSCTSCYACACIESGWKIRTNQKYLFPGKKSNWTDADGWKQRANAIIEPLKSAFLTTMTLPASRRFYYLQQWQEIGQIRRQNNGCSHISQHRPGEQNSKGKDKRPGQEWLNSCMYWVERVNLCERAWCQEKTEVVIWSSRRSFLRPNWRSREREDFVPSPEIVNLLQSSSLSTMFKII